MPWGIKKVKGGWKVYNKNSGKVYSKKPHRTKSKARAQLRAMYANVDESVAYDMLPNIVAEELDGEEE